MWVSLHKKHASMGRVIGIQGFSYIRGPVLRVPVIKPIIFGGLYWAALFRETTIRGLCGARLEGVKFFLTRNFCMRASPIIDIPP